MPLSHPIPVVFFALDSGREPVRDWLKDLDKDSKRAIGEDIKTLQFGWPIGMPLARKMDDNLWELRSKLDKGIARTFLYCIWKQTGFAAWIHQKIAENSSQRVVSCQA